MKFRSILSCLVVLMLLFACSSDGTADGTQDETTEEMEEEASEDPTEEVPNVDTISYVEKNGIVSVEFETVEGEIDWERGSSLEGFEGDGYLVWNNPDSFQMPGNGILTYTLQITTPGTYRFIWRSRITEGETQSEANDSWLRFDDADDFFGERDGSFVYPRDRGKTPNPEGSSRDGWLKVYMNRLGEWFWRSNTSDNDPHNIFVRFNEPGVYTMEVSGRSQFHGLDRFLLFVEGTTFEEAEAAERSEIVRP